MPTFCIASEAAGVLLSKAYETIKQSQQSPEGRLVGSEHFAHRIPATESKAQGRA
jgi:hypothetical protein